MKTKIKRINGEYVVKVWDDNGKRCPEKDYFTPSKQDAENTELLMFIHCRRVAGAALPGCAPFED